MPCKLALVNFSDCKKDSLYRLMQFCCLRKIYQIALKIMLLPIQNFLPEFAFYHVYCQFAQI